MSGSSRYPPIDSYGAVGDCRTMALISEHASVDWLCLPFFDSPSVFAALLDRGRGGRFSIAPTARFEVERRYLPDTNILETVFRTASGAVRVRDLVPVVAEEAKAEQLRPDFELLRLVEGVEGEVEVECRFDPRFDYGRIVPTLRDHGRLGFLAEHRSRALVLRCERPLERRDPAPGLWARWSVSAGDSIGLSMVFVEGQPAVLPPLGEHARERLETTGRWWSRWIGRCRYDGPFHEELRRSLLILKLLTYAPSGGVVGAATASLPEDIGGRRNWDYRFCWLRDASFTLRSFFDLGYEDEAQSFFDWLMHASRLTAPQLQVLYDLNGGQHFSERELGHLEGYRGSTPVRIGNGASSQLQLDVYGEVLSAAHDFLVRGGELDGSERKLLAGLGQEVVRSWERPDNGLWEPRVPPRQHTHSKLMCWVALSRLLDLAEQGVLDASRDTLRSTCGRVGETIERHGFSDRLDSYVSWFGGDVVDSSLLLIGLHGFRPPSDPRVVGTVRRIREHLGEGPFLRRYGPDFEDGQPGAEGAFWLTSFWGVQERAARGDIGGARRDLQEMLDRRRGVGLLSEEFDPNDDVALGNLPQAFSHTALIHAILLLDDAERRAGEGRAR